MAIKQHMSLTSPDQERAESTLMFTAELLRLIYEMDHMARRVRLRALLTEGYTELSGEAKRLGREFKRLDI